MLSGRDMAVAWLARPAGHYQGAPASSPGLPTGPRSHIHTKPMSANLAERNEPVVPATIARAYASAGDGSSSEGGAGAGAAVPQELGELSLPEVTQKARTGATGGGRTSWHPAILFAAAELVAKAPQAVPMAARRQQTSAFSRSVTQLTMHSNHENALTHDSSCSTGEAWPAGPASNSSRMAASGQAYGVGPSSLGGVGGRSGRMSIPASTWAVRFAHGLATHGGAGGGSRENGNRGSGPGALSRSSSHNASHSSMARQASSTLHSQGSALTDALHRMAGGGGAAGAARCVCSLGRLHVDA